MSSYSAISSQNRIGRTSRRIVPAQDRSGRLVAECSKLQPRSRIRTSSDHSMSKPHSAHA